MLDDLISVKYATVFNLYSPKSKTEKGAVLSAWKKYKEYFALGYVKPLNLNNGKNRQTRFFTATEAGAREADRIEDFADVDRKANSSVNHEFCKIDVCLAFKRLFGVRMFDYNQRLRFPVLNEKGHQKIDKDDKPIFKGHTPDAFFRIGDFNYMLEIELKDRPDKVIKYISETYNQRQRYLVLVVYIGWDYRERGYIFKRPQTYTQEMGELADNEMERLVKHKNFKNLPENIRVMHFHDFHRLNEAVWYRPDGGKVKLIN